MRRSVLVLGLGGGFLAGVISPSGPGFAEAGPLGDPDAGRQKAGQCRTCHGIDGVARIPIAPHIGGEAVDYIGAQLKAFRDGTRTHEMMSVVARGLSDTDIADLATWYAALEPVATPPADHDPQKAPSACVACHGADGIAVFADAPHLAGESEIYILTQLKAFRSGKRTHEIMSPIAADLTDQDMRAAAEWYARVGFSTSSP